MPICVCKLFYLASTLDIAIPPIPRFCKSIIIMAAWIGMKRRLTRSNYNCTPGLRHRQTERERERKRKRDAIVIGLIYCIRYLIFLHRAQCYHTVVYDTYSEITFSTKPSAGKIVWVLDLVNDIYCLEGIQDPIVDTCVPRIHSQVSIKHFK